jgi:hypothetical protein
LSLPGGFDIIQSSGGFENASRRRQTCLLKSRPLK